MPPSSGNRVPRASTLTASGRKKQSSSPTHTRSVPGPAAAAVAIQRMLSVVRTKRTVRSRRPSERFSSSGPPGVPPAEDESGGAARSAKRVHRSQAAIGGGVMGYSCCRIGQNGHGGVAAVDGDDRAAGMGAGAAHVKAGHRCAGGKTIRPHVRRQAFALEDVAAGEADLLLDVRRAEDLGVDDGGAGAFDVGAEATDGTKS